MDSMVAKIAEMESNDFILKQGYHCKQFSMLIVMHNLNMLTEQQALHFQVKFLQPVIQFLLKTIESE